MKKLSLFLLFFAFINNSYAQFERGQTALGSNIGWQMRRYPNFNQQAFSFSPSIQHWSSPHWSHNWGLDYNLLRLTAGQNTFLIYPDLLAKQARFHTFYADYSLRYWGKAWVENSLKPYSFAGLGLGFGQERLKNDNATQEFWTYNSRLKAGIGLFWKINSHLSLDFQLPIFSAEGSYNIDTKAFQPNIQLNPLQSNWRLGIFYPLNR